MRDLIVTGSGRSGTSLVAGTLAGAGYFLGGEPHAPRAANPKGFFETHEVNGLNELLLARVLPRHPRYTAGQRWLAVPPAGLRLEVEPLLQERMDALVARRPFLFKDPRFAWTLPAWGARLDGALRLCVFREPAATATSLRREVQEAEYLRGVELSFEQALATWTALYENVLERLSSDGEWLFLHYDQLFDPACLAQLERHCGARVARDFPERSLKRSRADRPVPPETAELYARLCERAGHRPAGEPLRVVVPAASAPTDEPREESAPELSVILCTHERRAVLAEALEAWEAQTAGRFELVVVDDGSQDGTRELLEGRDWRIPALLRFVAPCGLAEARNHALALARGRLVLFVNDDTIPFPDLVERHLEAHARLGRPACVLGTFEQPREALDGALTRLLERTDLVFRYADLVPGAEHDANRFWTCNLSVPAEAVSRAGGFDEEFRHYGVEDIELGVRLERLGLRVVYEPRARALHRHLLSLADLERRQAFVGRAFVRLFVKHPGELERPDWAWLAGESRASLEAEVARGLARTHELRLAAAELARVDLGAFEHEGRAGSAAAEAVLLALEPLLRELNLWWWRASLARGLAEQGLESFAELRSRASRNGALECLASARERAEAELEALRREAAAGELDLATILGARLGARLEPHAADARARGLLADLLNDLGVLRFTAADLRGARALLEAALALEPEHALARANQADLGGARVVPPRRPEPASAKPDEANPWVRELLELGERRVGFAGKHVIEVGGAVPAAVALATGARSWRALFLKAQAAREGVWEVRDADARALPFEDAACDLVFSSCAFEHVHELERALREIRRVLRPGGVLVTSFAPVWTSAVGHHLWLLDEAGLRIDFLDPALPRWGHLALSRAELEWYLARVFGPAFAARAREQVHENPHINRQGEAAIRRAFAASGLDAAALEALPAWEGSPRPSARLAAELERLHPGAGDFGVPGLRGVIGREPRAGRARLRLVGAERGKPA